MGVSSLSKTIDFGQPILAFKKPRKSYIFNLYFSIGFWTPLYDDESRSLLTSLDSRPADSTAPAKSYAGVCQEAWLNHHLAN